ncbi:hypothetical protein U9M48_043639 [Paspalum notatum var. saurae]|uniref:RING-type E3 ubiquitin transferase n=1 Tax=Paspalum notatum var. saurae TaxID=547442 RepID=A0AAQ3XHB8_PASNO
MSSSALGSGSLSPAAAASAPEVEDTSRHWAPHGAVLTGCVVGINVLTILLIIFFFWRFFSRGAPPGPSASAGGGADHDDDASSSESLPVASPWASRRRREDRPAKAPPLDDVVSALPVYVYSTAGGADADGGPAGKSPECAVCIVELRDGDSARLLPRCGHRFHADCVGAWLRLHATCPLCRARVVAPKAAAATGEARNAKDDDDNVGADDCPV